MDTSKTYRSSSSSSESSTLDSKSSSTSSSDSTHSHHHISLRSIHRKLQHQKKRDREAEKRLFMIPRSNSKDSDNYQNSQSKSKSHRKRSSSSDTTSDESVRLHRETKSDTKSHGRKRRHKKRNHKSSKKSRHHRSPTHYNNSRSHAYTHRTQSRSRTHSRDRDLRSDRMDWYTRSQSKDRLSRSGSRERWSQPQAQQGSSWGRHISYGPKSALQVNYEEHMNQQNGNLKATNWEEEMRSKNKRDRKKNLRAYDQIKAEWRHLQEEKQLFKQTMREKEANQVQTKIDEVHKEEKKQKNLVSHCQWWDDRLKIKEVQLLEDYAKCEQSLSILNQRIKKQQENEQRFAKKEEIFKQDEIHLEQEKEILIKFLKVFGQQDWNEMDYKGRIQKVQEILMGKLHEASIRKEKIKESQRVEQKGNEETIGKGDVPPGREIECSDNVQTGGGEK